MTISTDPWSPDYESPQASGWQRHRLLASNVVTFLLTALAAASVIAWLYLTMSAELQEAKHQEYLAQQHAGVALEQLQVRLDQLLAQVTEDSSLKYNRAFSNVRKSLLQAAMPFYDWLAENSTHDLEVPNICARAYGRLGQMYASIGEQDQALGAFAKQRAIISRTAANSVGNPEPLSQLGLVCHHLAQANIALGRTDEARELLGQAVHYQNAALAITPLQARYRSFLADHFNGLGNFFVDQEEIAEAESPLKEALALRTKVMAEQPGQFRYAYLLAETQRDLGGVVLALGRPAEAEPLLQEAMKRQQKLLTDYPHITDLRVALAATQFQTATLLRNGGALDKALPMVTQAIATLEAVEDQEPSRPTLPSYLRAAHTTRAETLQRLGRHADAVPDWNRAMLLVDEPRRSRLRIRLATALARAGDAEGALAQVKTFGEAPASVELALQLGRVCAIASAAGQDAALRERCAVRAVEFLRQALAKGYKDTQHLKKDADWDAVREREDFRRLIGEAGQ